MLIKIIEFLSSNLKYVLALYVISAVVLIFSVEITYTSDSLYYYKLAQECINSSEFYPASQHLYEDYIVSPFYVNFITGILLLKNSTISICMLNLIIIFVQIFFLYKIVKRIFSETTANLTILFFIFYLNTLGLIFLNLSELLFVLTLILSIYLFLLDSKKSLFAAGLLVGISIAVRPLGWAFIAAVVLFHLFQFIKVKKSKLKLFYVYAGTSVFIILFGTFTYSHFGTFEFTATTGPVNLLLGSNDDATGGFNATVFEKGKIGYLENPESLTYKQKGGFYFNQAVKWIQENPGVWITLFPMKIIHTFIWDDVAVTALLNVEKWNFLKSIKIFLIEKDLNSVLPNSGFGMTILYFFVQFIHQAFYFILLYMITIGTVRYFKGKYRSREIHLILVFSFLSILMIIFTVGAPRYKYHIIILLLPIAANYLERKLSKGTKEIAKP